MPNIESPNIRHERYIKAATLMSQSKTLLRDGYDYFAPGNARFDETTPGDDRNSQIFDATSIQSLIQFANNIQSVLMPPFRRWASLQPGYIINQSAQVQINKEQLRLELQEQTEILFKYLDGSTFNQAVNQSLVDMGISTGALLLNEGTKEKPLEFKAISIDQLAFEEASNGKLENVWRKWNVKLRHIHQKWPNAKLPEALASKINTSPDEEVELIEGTLFYPDNEEHEKYFYYVQISEDKKDIVQEFRSYSPWIIFRWNVRTGESLGFGPALASLSFTKSLNKLVELELKAATLKAYPPYMATDSETINPYMIRIEPGSIIPVGAFTEGDPIKPVPTNGDPQFAQLLKKDLQEDIRDILFANPLPPGNIPNQTATEVSIRQDNWIRSSGTAFGRLTVELLDPIIRKCTIILKKFGLMENVVIDGRIVDVQYDSPLIALQGKTDMQAIEAYMSFFQNTLGPESIFAVTNAVKLPGVVAEKLNVDAEIVPSEEKLINDLSNLQQQLNPQAQQEQAEQAALPPEVPEPQQ